MERAARTPSASLSEGTASAQAINAAMEVRELQGEEAAEAISDFAGLELLPIPEDEQRTRLRRAGFSIDESARRALRDEQKGGAA